MMGSPPLCHSFVYAAPDGIFTLSILLASKSNTHTYRSRGQDSSRESAPNKSMLRTPFSHPGADSNTPSAIAFYAIKMIKTITMVRILFI